MKSVLVTGGSGLVGSAIKELVEYNYDNYHFLYINSKQVDLRNYDETLEFFKYTQPDYVIHLAACVGGLYKNMNENMYTDNVRINTNVIDCAYKVGVKRLIACLSTCIFPDKTVYPIDETMLHNGPPHESNEGYAYAKRMMEVQCKLYNKYYDTKFVCIIPTNIFGEHDNYNLEDSHVIPALIHKCYLAKKDNTAFIIKGSGKPLRQFIYSMDIAKIIILLLDKNTTESLIIAPDNEVPIKKVVEMIAKQFDQSTVIYNEMYDDGQYRKTTQSIHFKKLFPEFIFSSLEESIKITINYFINNYETIRK